MLCLIKCIWIYLRCKITPIEFDHKWENRNIVLVMKKKSYAPHWPFLLKPQERGSLKKLIYLSSHFLWLQRVGMFSEIAHFSHLWNPYTPVGAGYLPRTFQTAEHGTTLRLPLLKYLCLSSINCLYAAFLNCRILLSKGSFLVSALLKIQGCKMSGSRQSLWNLCVKVTQSFFFFFLQYTFSTDLGICLQCPHLHHSGTGGVGGPGLSGSGCLSGVGHWVGGLSWTSCVSEGVGSR